MLHISTVLRSILLSIAPRLGRMLGKRRLSARILAFAFSRARVGASAAEAVQVAGLWRKFTKRMCLGFFPRALCGFGHSLGHRPGAA